MNSAFKQTIDVSTSTSPGSTIQIDILREDLSDSPQGFSNERKGPIPRIEDMLLKMTPLVHALKEAVHKAALGNEKTATVENARKQPEQKDAKLDELEIEFGVRLGGETGLIIAKGSTDCHFSIKLKWKAY